MKSVIEKTINGFTATGSSPRWAKNDSPQSSIKPPNSSLMTHIKRFMLACLLALLGTTANASVTYLQNFDSGTDSWISRGSGDANGYSTFANVAGGQSGNCLQVTDGGYGWGAARLITGVVAGESYTYSIWVKLPTSVWVYSTTDPKIFVRQETSAGALVGTTKRSAQITTVGSWVQVTLTGTIAATATQVKIGIGDSRGAGSYSMNLDTVSFVSVNNSAATRTWDGLGADDLISNGANWGGTAPIAGDFAIFDGSVRLTPSLDASLSLSGITFTNGAGAFSITRPGSEVLTTTGDILNTSGNLQTIGAQVTISGSGKTINTGASGISLTAGTVATSGFTKTGAGTLTLSGGTSPNLAGTVTISEGNVLVNANDQIADTATLSIASGASLELAAGVTETIKGFKVESATQATTTGNVILGANAELTVVPAVSAGYSAVSISGTTGTKFIVNGAEVRWTPENMTNTFEKLVVGPTGRLRTAHGGNAWNGSDSSLGAVPASFLQDQITLNDGTLGLNGGDLLNKIVLDANRGITLQGTTATIETLVDGVIPGKITGTGALSHIGGRDLELQGLNDFSGGLNLGAGTVTVGNVASVGTGPISITANTGSLAVNAEGLDFTNGLDLTSVVTNTFGGTTNYTISGDVNMGDTGTAILRVSEAANSVTLSGALTNVLGFTKDGPGTLVLSGANTYAGATVVSNGTLKVIGSGATSTNTVTVSGGTLAGTGPISGALTVNSGGTLNAGSSPGTLATADLVWNGGGTNVVEVNNATGTQGVNWDLISVTGTLTINATVGDKFTIDPTSLTSGNVAGLADNFDGVSDQNWTIVTTTGGIVGYDSSAFDIPTNNFQGIPDGGSFRVLLVGNDLVLHYSLVQPPLIVAEPTASQTVVSGTTVVLSATAIGTEPLVYRWEKDTVLVTDGGDISGATTASLTLANTVPGSSGSYVMIVTNSAGSDTSSAGVLTVLDPVVITVQPAGATIQEGTNFNPSVTATGGGTLTYQWKKGGVDLTNTGNISGADTASLLITGALVGDAGDYSVAVSNEVSNATSGDATLIVQAAPVITVQPQSVSTTDGATANFSVTATGHSLEYQWSRNGVDISGATDSSYSVAASASTIGDYSVVVSNSLGTATSDLASLSIGSAVSFSDNFDSYADQAAFNAVWTGTTPVVLGSPANSAPNSVSQTTAANQSYQFINPIGGSNMTFTCSMYDPAANNSGRAYAMVYSRVGTTWAGGLNNLLAIGRYNGSTNPKYYGRCSTATGAVYTDGATFLSGGWFSLGGAADTSVGWHEMKIVGEADPDNAGKHRFSFYVDGVLGGRVANINAYDYNWVVAGSGLSSTGAGASFDDYVVSTLTPTLDITAQPQSVSTNAGSTVVLSVTAPSATVYQWKKDGSEISGATDSSLTLNNVLKADEGSYSVYLENGYYTGESDAAVLTVNDPAILTQPASVTNGLGTNTVFSVVAAGTPSLTYQWKKGGVDLSDGGNISGATTADLTVSSIGVSDGGDYTVAVTNSLGDGIISDAATLATIEPPTIDTQPVSLAGINQGADVTFTVGASGVLLEYQWSFGATPISGATDSSLTLVNVQTADTLDTYSVTVSNPAGSVTSDAASLSIIADTFAPKVTVTTPKKSAGTNSASINVTGFAKDSGTGNSGIIKWVRYVYNGGNAITSTVTNDATITDLGKGAWSFTSATPLTLTPGTNSIQVSASDLAGNVTDLVPFIFYYDLTNDLVLTINGEGQVKMGTNLWSSSQTITNIFKVGRPYKIDAFVGKGTNYVFTNWTTGPVVSESATNKWVQKSSLSFVMQENMTVDAKFMTNPFTTVAGTYNGLFSETAGVTHETAGFIQVKVKDKSSFSGYLLFDGIKRPFSGKLLTDGTITQTVSRSKFPPQDDVSLSLAVDLNGETVSGTVSATNGAWVADITADKAVFSDKTVPAVLDTTYVGNYTLQLPTGAGAPTLSPGGVSYGTVTNSPGGYIKLGGLLADGQKLNQKVNISRNGDWPLYVGLYKNAAEKAFKGSIMGWVKFTTNDFGPSTDNILTWIKKDGSDVVAQYGAGFSNSLEMAGSPYVAPAIGDTPIPMLVGDYVIVSDGTLSEPQTNVVTAIAPTASGTKVTLATTTTMGVVNKASIAFKFKDGTFTGGFFPAANPTVKTKTQGAVLQNSGAAAGWFLSTGTSESGTVRVQAAP